MTQTSLLLPTEPLHPPMVDIALDTLPANEDLLGEPEPAFVDSVRAFGVLQPVLLVQMDNGLFWPAAGVRRIKAARACAMPTIPARVYPSGWALTGSISLIENEQRHPNPMMEAAALRRMLKQGVDVSTIAKELRISLPTLRKRMRLLDLCDELWMMAEAGQMAVGVACMAARLKPAQQRELVQKGKVCGYVSLGMVVDVKRVQVQEAVGGLDSRLFETPQAEESPLNQARAALQEAHRLLCPVRPVIAQMVTDILSQMEVMDEGVLGVGIGEL